MTKQQLIFILLCLCIASSMALIRMYFKRRRYDLLINTLKQKDFEKLDKLLSSKVTQFFLAPFNIDYLRLNSAIMRNDKEMIAKCFEEFDRHRLNKKQKEEVYMKGFNYFIYEKDYDNAKKYLDKVNTLDNEKMKQEAECIYDVYALKGYKYLDFLLEETEKLDDIYKGVNEFLISMMYKNKGDDTLSQKYNELSKKHMKLLDKHITDNTK